MRQFYLGKTSSGYYKAYFIDPVTGSRDYGKSTVGANGSFETLF